jgi:hypothetical protein
LWAITGSFSLDLYLLTPSSKIARFDKIGSI